MAHRSGNEGLAMTEKFKKASLYNNHRRTSSPPRQGHVTPPILHSKRRKCEHQTSGLCEVSREAVNLGLREEAISCTGNIPPDCMVRQKLAAGLSIQELFKRT